MCRFYESYIFTFHISCVCVGKMYSQWWYSIHGCYMEHVWWKFVLSDFLFTFLSICVSEDPFVLDLKLAEKNVYKESNICIFSFQSIRILCLVEVFCSQCELHIDQYQIVWLCLWVGRRCLDHSIWLAGPQSKTIAISLAHNRRQDWPLTTPLPWQIKTSTINRPEWLFSIFSHFRCQSSFLLLIGESPHSPHKPILTSTVRTDQNNHGSAFCTFCPYFIIINWQNQQKGNNSLHQALFPSIFSHYFPSLSSSFSLIYTHTFPPSLLVHSYKTYTAPTTDITRH